MNDKIYIVSAIHVKELTEEDHRKDYEIAKITHGPQWTMTFEEYKKFITSWKRDKYSFDIQDTAYFLEKSRAITCVEGNIGSINEAGSYDYASVVGVPIGCTYAKTEAEDEDVWLFKFNPKIEQYMIIDESADDFEDYKELYILLKEAVRDIITGGVKA